METGARPEGLRCSPHPSLTLGEIGEWGLSQPDPFVKSVVRRSDFAAYLATFRERHRHK